MPVTRSTALFAFVLAGPPALLAQTDPAPDAGEVVTKACEKMRLLPGVKWQTTEKQDSALTRRFAGRVGGNQEVEIDGRSSAGVVQATLNDGDDEIVRRGDRMLARNAGGAWKLRSGVLAEGAPLPFVFDAERFFERLGALPAAERKVLQSTTETFRDREYRVLSFTLGDEAAREFVFAGCVPAVGMRVPLFGGLPFGGNAQAAPPEMLLDIALYVDPETGLVHRARTRAAQEGGIGGGNVQIQVAGAGFGDQDEEHEEEVKEFDDQGNRRYERGLPVRKIGKSTSVMDFDVRFSEHGKTFAPELDAPSRALLDRK
jgi:hypothetical protein